MNIQNIYSHFLKSKGINTDSRSIQKGEIFIALKGDHFNGNAYAKQAIEDGASLAIVDEEIDLPDNKYVLVPDSLKCLQDLAKIHRSKLNVPVIAVTGSNGKTTTKELTAAVLQKKFNVHYTKGNLNNHIGVPLTILKIKSADMVIIEMGANHPGEINQLCEIADPDFGIITNIGKAHLEGFGSFEGVIKAKSELYHYLDSKNGHIFINGTNHILIKLASQTRLNKISYYEGENLICDGYSSTDTEFLQVNLKFINGSNWNCSTNLSGSYNLENILAAATIGKYFRVEENYIIEAIESYKPTNYRSQVFNSEHNKIIIDAYNANPTSMAEAIHNFSKLPGGNKLLILGEMKELGPFSDAEHKNLLEVISKFDFHEIYLCGKDFFQYREKYNYSFFENTDELFEHLSSNPVIDHLILLKSSRAGKFEKLLEVL